LHNVECKLECNELIAAMAISSHSKDATHPTASGRPLRVAVTGSASSVPFEGAKPVTLAFNSMAKRRISAPALVGNRDGEPLTAARTRRVEADGIPDPE
jgi:hypothetical protein